MLSQIVLDLQHLTRLDQHLVVRHAVADLVHRRAMLIDGEHAPQPAKIGGNLFQRHGIFHPLASPEPAVLRVPSLRNVAATPPYFHDGSAPTLDVAVRKMARAQLNSELTDRQAEVIVAFLRTITG